MKLLTEQGLVFDLHCNWFQLAEAATYFTTHSPSTVVVLDHLGCVKLDTGSADEDNKRIEEWKQGMTALSANPNVNVKISGLEYIKANWLVSGSASRAVIQDLVVFVVKTFSPSRCMVASNWPVDLFMGKSTLTELYVGIHDLLSSFTVEERQAIFYGNAMRVYGVDKL
jgi:predicted TIM-barrel fold metal-dependent hydrolase